jgi:hypothetical protein
MPNPEVKRRTHRGLLNTLVYFLVTSILMIVMAWCVLLAEFSVYRVDHGQDAFEEKFTILLQIYTQELHDSPLSFGEKKYSLLDKWQRKILFSSFYRKKYLQIESRTSIYT